MKLTKVVELMNIMKFRKTLSSVVFVFVLSSASVLAQSQIAGETGGFFSEGAEVTVVQAATLRDDGIINVDYLGTCDECETRLSYDQDTKIFAGVNSVELDYRNIASLQYVSASVFVNSENYIYKIRLFKVPGAR